MIISSYVLPEAPESLPKNVNSVVNFSNVDIEITGKFIMTETYQWSITVLNPSGNAHVRPAISYGPKQRITAMTAEVFDRNGRRIKSFKKRDSRDRTIISDAAVFLDYRISFFEYTPTSYPYTFRFKAKRRGENTAFIPDWIPISDEYQAVNSSTYSLSYPNGWNLTTSELNFATFEVTRNNDPGSYRLQVENIEPFQDEYRSVSTERFLPRASLSLNHFRLEGVTGKVDSWSEFGRWYRDNMLQGLDKVPEATLNEVLSLVEGKNDQLEKARLIYDYAQSKTRYVNIAVGIGGWKPMSVEDVLRTGYGDCKALSLFTKTLLRAAGIQAYYTIVYAGSQPRDIDSTQVTIQGNHIILYVPLDDTTVWLETTGSSIPFGYLGTHSDDRLVISLTDDGAIVHKTPKLADSVNKQASSAIIEVMSDGSFRTDISIISKGIQYGMRSHLATMRYADIENFYKNHWNYLQGVMINSYEIAPDKRKIMLREDINLASHSIGSVAGNRILITAALLNRYYSVPPRHPNRKYPIEILRGFVDEDHYVIIVPEGFKIEHIPEDIYLDSKFGDYSLKFSNTGDNILEIVRKIHMKSGLFAPGCYEDYYRFRRDISRFDQTNLIIQKQ